MRFRNSGRKEPSRAPARHGPCENGLPLLTGIEAKGRAQKRQGRPNIRGHDDEDGVAEVDRPSRLVGQPPGVEHLEEEVLLAARLLELVEEQDGERVPATAR